MAVLAGRRAPLINAQAVINGEEIDYARWLKEARGLADSGDDA